MQLDKNIIHARYGKLTVATDQDQTSGLYLLSHTDKRRRNEWNPRTGLGFTDEGIPYISESLAISAFTYVFSEIRDESELKKRYKEHKQHSREKLPKYDEWRLTPNSIEQLTHYHRVRHRRRRRQPCIHRKSDIQSLITVLNCEYVSATFKGNSPAVDEEGMIVREEGKPLIIRTERIKKKQKERIIVHKGKLIKEP